eukprot:14575572-Alexandrium_andersonii.AAC.1
MLRDIAGAFASSSHPQTPRRPTCRHRPKGPRLPPREWGCSLGHLRTHALSSPFQSPGREAQRSAP